MEATINGGFDRPGLDGAVYCGMARRRAPVVDISRARDIRGPNRNRLGDLTQYMPLVKRIAKLAKFAPGCGVTLEDAEQEGFIGLMDAAEKWDPDSGTKFETYAQYRI